MNIALAFLVGCLAVLGTTAAPQYTTKYDNIDLDKILTSERLLKNYINCLMDEGVCTADGKELKEALPDALATGCKKCSEKHKNGAEQVIRFLIKNKPKEWAELTKKYDPEGKWRERYSDMLEKDEGSKETPKDAEEAVAEVSEKTT